jgi:hypothetical protein
MFNLAMRRSSNSTLRLIGYQLKHIALHGAQRYDHAIKAFEVMLAKMDSAHDLQIRNKL